MTQNRYSRYLAIQRWAARRYTSDGRLVLSIGGNPSRYVHIEALAAGRYLFDGPEALRLRDMWTHQGVSIGRQNAMLKGIASAAGPGAMVGPFAIGGRR